MACLRKSELPFVLSIILLYLFIFGTCLGTVEIQSSDRLGSSAVEELANTTPCQRSSARFLKYHIICELNTFHTCGAIIGPQHTSVRISVIQLCSLKPTPIDTNFSLPKSMDRGFMLLRYSPSLCKTS